MPKHPSPHTKRYHTLVTMEHDRIQPAPGIFDRIRSLARRFSRRSTLRRHPLLHLLTRRERQVLELVGRGFTNREIAETLVIAPETVKTHMTNIRAKLQISSKTELRHWFSRPETEE